MPFAPSAQHHVVPPDVSDDDFGESDSDLETRLTRTYTDVAYANLPRLAKPPLCLALLQNGKRTCLFHAMAIHYQTPKMTSL